MDINNLVRAKDVSVVELFGEVDIGAVGAVGTSTALGFVVTRTAQGDYKCTLDRAYPELLYARMELHHGTRTDGTTHTKSHDMTATVREVSFFYNVAGVSGDPPDGSKLYFKIVLKDSTVGP